MGRRQSTGCNDAAATKQLGRLAHGEVASIKNERVCGAQLGRGMKKASSYCPEQLGPRMVLVCANFPALICNLEFMQSLRPSPRTRLVCKPVFGGNEGAG